MLRELSDVTARILLVIFEKLRRSEHTRTGRKKISILPLRKPKRRI